MKLVEFATGKIGGLKKNIRRGWEKISEKQTEKKDEKKEKSPCALPEMPPGMRRHAKKALLLRGISFILNRKKACRAAAPTGYGR